MKRRPLSMIRLYKIAANFAEDNYANSPLLKKRGAQDMKVVTSFLKYTFEHKDDEL